MQQIEGGGSLRRDFDPASSEIGSFRTRTRAVASVTCSDLYPDGLMQLLLLFLVLLAPAAVGAVQHQPRLQILTKPRSHQLSQALVFSAAPRVEAKSSRHPHSHPHTVARSSRRAAVGGALAFAFASAAHAVGCPCDSCSGHELQAGRNTVDSSSPCAPAVDDHGLGCECDEC